MRDFPPSKKKKTYMDDNTRHTQSTDLMDSSPVTMFTIVCIYKSSRRMEERRRGFCVSIVDQHREAVSLSAHLCWIGLITTYRCRCVKTVYTSESVSQTRQGRGDAGKTRGKTARSNSCRYQEECFGNQAHATIAVDACSKVLHRLWTW